MPRGDHKPGCCRKDQPCKRIGEPRPNRSNPSLPQYIPDSLRRRIAWFESNKERPLQQLDPKTIYDRESGHVWHRPGSQKK